MTTLNKKATQQLLNFVEEENCNLARVFGDTLCSVIRPGATLALIKDADSKGRIKIQTLVGISFFLEEKIFQSLERRTKIYESLFT